MPALTFQPPENLQLSDSKMKLMRRAFGCRPDLCFLVPTRCWNKRPTWRWRWDSVSADGQAARLVLQVRLGRQLQPGECARHTCDVPNCINPNHVLLGTQQDNARDLVLKRYRVTQDPEIIRAIEEMRARGTSQLVIAKELGISQPSVSNILRGMACAGIDLRTGFTNQDVLDLREQGLTQQQIGKLLGCSQTTVSAILAGRRRPDTNRKVPYERSVGEFV